MILPARATWLHCEPGRSPALADVEVETKVVTIDSRNGVPNWGSWA